MTEKKPISKKGFSADWFLQGALTRIGDTVDRFTGRRWTPSSSLATSELIERIKKLLDAEAKEIPGKGVVVPHNINLKIQWDKFSTDTDGALTKLENELLTAAADHINDSLYYTYAPLKLEVMPDYFTEGVKLFVNFDKFSDEESEGVMSVTIPTINIKKENADPSPVKHSVGEIFIARFEISGCRRDRRLEFPPLGRLTVGRTGGNDLAIDDASVSKIHASLVIDAESRLSVADTGSTNGTFVNGQRISYGQATRLAAGDRVKFGLVEVVLEHVPQPLALDIEKADDESSFENKSEIGGFEFISRTANSTTISEMADDVPEKTLDIDPTIGEANVPSNRPKTDESK